MWDVGNEMERGGRYERDPWSNNDHITSTENVAEHVDGRNVAFNRVKII